MSFYSLEERQVKQLTRIANSLERLVDAVDALASSNKEEVSEERPHGVWIETYNAYDNSTKISCDICGYSQTHHGSILTFEKPRDCPACGAIMHKEFLKGE